MRNGKGSFCWRKKSKNRKNIVLRFAKEITEVIVALSDEAEASSAGAHLAKE